MTRLETEKRDSTITEALDIQANTIMMEMGREKARETAISILKRCAKTIPPDETQNFKQFLVDLEREHDQMFGEILSPEVKEALSKVDRMDFVPDLPDAQKAAYYLEPMYIGKGQTISHPAVVAFMINQLDIQSDESLLEIGSGSGYAAAVMAQIPHSEIITLEQDEMLARVANANLSKIVDVKRSPRVIHNTPEAFEQLQLSGPKFNKIVSAAEFKSTQEAKPFIEMLEPEGTLLCPLRASDGKTYFFTYTQENQWVNTGHETNFAPYIDQSS